ncbi:MAG: alpha/beta hydrolase [Bdellovibrionales bacterium]
MSVNIVEYQLPQLKNFFLENVEVKSNALAGNRLKDPSLRYNPIMTPKSFSEDKLPLVVILAGFTGNGPKYLGERSFEDNMAQQIDSCFSEGEAPEALYLFVDAWSKFGGSQFINSKLAGNYEDYIVHELISGVKDCYPVDSSKVCVMGVSSGGYGALHLGSKYPEVFPYVAALAPDSYFESCYLPDIYKAAPFLAKHKTFKAISQQLDEGRVLRRRDGHSILNAIGMAICYSPKEKGMGFDIPINIQTGELDSKIWKRWKSFDPVQFLAKRSKNTQKLKKLYLEVGIKDQFHLYFGARQIKRILKESKVKLHYNEFDGTHFDFAERRPALWSFLNKIW